MIPPVRMVFISLIFSLLLITGIIFYRYVFPRKKISHFPLLVLISLLPIISIFRNGSYESGDFTIHVYRSMSFFTSLSEGYVLPSWSKELNAGFGYPLFIFLNPLAYYINVLFHTFGFSFILSMKLFLALTYIFSGVTMFMWIKTWLKNSFAAFSAAIMYLFAPYHLVDLHFRATVGEMLIFCLLPFALYRLTLLARKPTSWNIVFAGSALSLLILSHQAVAMFCFVFTSMYLFYLYIFEKLQSQKVIVASIASYVVALVSASFALVPHLIYSKYVIHVNYPMIFPHIKELLFSPWRWGLLFQGHFGELSFLIGYSHLLILIITLIISVKKKSKNHVLRYWLLITLIFIFMITPLSNVIWTSVPLINITILSTRLLIFVIIGISILTALLTSYFTHRKYILYLFLAISIGYTILNWGHRRVIPEIADKQLKQSLPQSTFQGEGWGAGVPKWQGEIAWESTSPKKSLEIIEGEGEIHEIYKKSEEHRFTTHSSTRLVIQDNTWYFPGWKVLIDDTYQTTIQENKLITFTVPSGFHTVKVFYDDLPLYKFAKILSFCSFLLIVIFFVYQSIINYATRIKYKR